MADPKPSQAAPSGNALTHAQTKLHSEGAEFLVLGQLLTRGVAAHKAYSGYTGYDVIAHSVDGNRTCASAGQVTL